MKKLILIASFVYFGDNAEAFIPLPSQIIRHQAELLRASRPFTVKGTLSVSNTKIPLLLQWNGPMQYSVVLSQIPTSIYSSPIAASASWTLYRRAKTCVIKSETLTVNCTAPNLWALLELSAQAETIAKAMTSGGWLSESATHAPENTFPATREEKIKSGAADGVVLNLGSNGDKPIAVIEFNQGRPKSKENQDSIPLLQFEQTFLAPVFLRSQDGDGDFSTVKATFNAEVSKKKARLSHVLADTLDIYLGKTQIASLSRNEKEFPEKTKATPPPTALSELSVLRNTLSDEGQLLLKSLLLTH